MRWQVAPRLDEHSVRTFANNNRQFEAKLPAKKFRKYVCVGRYAGAHALDTNSAQALDKQAEEVTHKEHSNAV